MSEELLPEELMDESIPEGRMLLYFQEKNYQRLIGHYENLIPEFQKCINAFNALGVGNLQQEEFINLFLGFEDLVKKKRLNKPGDKFVMIGEEKVSRETLIDMSQKPNGYFTLFAEIDRLVKKIEVRMRLIGGGGISSALDAPSVKSFLNLFTFNSEGQLIVEEFVYEDVKEYCSAYIKSEKGKKMTVFARAFEKFMSEHDVSDLMYSRDQYDEFISSILHYQPGKAGLQINYDVIKRTDYR